MLDHCLNCLITLHINKDLSANLLLGINYVLQKYIKNIKDILKTRLGFTLIYLHTCSWTIIPPIIPICNQYKQLRISSNSYQTGGPFCDPNTPNKFRSNSTMDFIIISLKPI